MNDNIYSGFTEHPEYPIDDERRFSLSIRPHAFECPSVDGATRRPANQGCMRCGFPQFEDQYRNKGPLHPVHQV